jgi:hypothetical protein
LRECLIDERGMVKADEWMESWCRMRKEKKVVNNWMEGW